MEEYFVSAAERNVLEGVINYADVLYCRSLQGRIEEIMEKYVSGNRLTKGFE